LQVTSFVADTWRQFNIHSHNTEYLLSDIGAGDRTIGFDRHMAGFGLSMHFFKEDYFHPEQSGVDYNA
jgi:hypothetical protein